MRGLSPNRVAALVLRYIHLMLGSWPRLLELTYWPTVQLILWGFISQFLRGNSSYVAQAGGVLMAGVLLWDVLFRGQLGVSVSFLEEMWSRNLGHLFVSPLRPIEFLAALVTMSFIRTIIGVGPAVLVAIPLFHYSVFSLGLPLIAFFFNLLVTGWCIGVAVSGLILRHGMGAENFAWMSVFALAPIGGIYYPVASLPGWLQYVALALPPAHVFEGMRAVMFEGRFPLDHFLWAVGLNLVLMALAGWVFLSSFEAARRTGRLLQMGE